MNAYEDLALSYDELTEDVDYPALLAYLRELLALLGARPGRVLDLACGTGSMTLLLCESGYEVIGADLSEDMLTMAYSKTASLPPEQRPLLIHQAMQALDLPKKADLALCLLDSLNYLTDPADLRETLRRVHDSLSEGGVFLFDVNTLTKFTEMDDQVWLDETDTSYCVWRTEYDAGTELCSYGVDLFRRRGRLWERSFEEHWERYYSPETLERLLREAGFIEVRFFGDRALTPPTPSDRRIFVAATRK